MSDATPSEAGQTVRLEVARTSPDGTDTGRRDVFDVPYDDRTSVLDALQWGQGPRRPHWSASSTEVRSS